MNNAELCNALFIETFVSTMGRNLYVVLIADRKSVV